MRSPGSARPTRTKQFSRGNADYGRLHLTRSFRRSETEEVTHKSTQQQSAELGSAGLRSKLKKAEKIRGSSLLEFLRFTLFFL